MKTRPHKEFKQAVDKWVRQADELLTAMDSPTADMQTVRGLMKAHNSERHFMLIEGLNAIKQGQHGPTWAKSLLVLCERPKELRAEKGGHCCVQPCNKCDGDPCCNKKCGKCERK